MSDSAPAGHPLHLHRQRLSLPGRRAAAGPRPRTLSHGHLGRNVRARRSAVLATDGSAGAGGGRRPGRVRGSAAVGRRYLRQADLVLGMTREHRSAAVDLVPAIVRRSLHLA